MRVLVVHALSAPTVFGLTRDEVLAVLAEYTRDPRGELIDELGAWSGAVTAVTLVEMRACTVYSTLEATH